jgi:hypothetical protein
MYKIGETRSITTKTLCGLGSVIIKEEDGSKCIELLSDYWTTLANEFDNIDEAVKQLRENKYVKYFKHIGGDFYVSVTTGFWCVDLRKFYLSKEGELKPKREGIALRLNEWSRVCDLRQQLDDDMTLLLGLSPPVVGEEREALFKFLQEYTTPICAYSHQTPNGM